MERSVAIENSWQFFLLRTDILQKTVVGCPVATIVGLSVAYLQVYSEASCHDTNCMSVAKIRGQNENLLKLF